MEDWQKELAEAWEVATHEVEQFFTEITEGAGEVFDSLLQLSEEFVEQLQGTIPVEFEQFFIDLIEPVVDIFEDFESNEGVNQADLFVHYVEPTEQKNPACRGCKNYHGQVYSGNLMVCGMHPYGWEGESCPDWESF